MSQEPQQKQTIIQRVAAELREILLFKNIHFTELFCGALTATWGAWLLNPAWATFGSTPTFKAMAELAPEWAWGALLVALGLMQLVGLLLDMYRTRRWASLLGLIIWAFIASTFAIANPASTATVVYPALATANAWCHVRLRLGRL